MASMRDIRRRIRSVKSTQQITRAMKMVAAAKLRKAQEAVIEARPYSDKLANVMNRLVPEQGVFAHPLLDERTEGKIGYVVISADRGLCGGYNQNILRFTKDQIDGQQEDSSVICVGRKAVEYFARRNYNIEERYVDFGDLPDYIQARELARELVAMYQEKGFKKIYMVYTQFNSVINQETKIVPLLPVTKWDQEQSEELEYIYEPSAEDVLGTLIPRSVEVKVFRSLLEAKASEHGARMTAMDSATDNASDLIDKLTLSYNRARQAAITKEISEIVGGAAALEQ